MRKDLNSPELLAQVLTHSFQQKFWSNVAIGLSGDCWNWKRARIKGGYGYCGIPGGKGQEYAHRLAWIIIFKKPIPDDKPFILHSCVGNKACCNPFHLRPGTPKENTDDMHRQGRGSIYHPQKGEKNGRAILNVAQVKEIRSSHAAGGITFAALSRRWKMSPSGIRNIVTRKLWPNVV